MIKVFSEYEIYLQSEDFNKIRQEVFERDGYKCIVCGSTENIVPHHLTYKNVYHEELRDLITLCSNCHAIHHNILNREREIDNYYMLSTQSSIIAEIKSRQKEREELGEKIAQEIKDEYLDQDYARNGPLNMADFKVLNEIISQKEEKYKNQTFYINKIKLRDWFVYRRCEFFKRCIDKNISIDEVFQKSHFSYSYLRNNYRKDYIEAKLEEEKLLNKED